jgi:hypothetical protein
LLLSTLREAQSVTVHGGKKKLLARLIIQNNFVKEVTLEESLQNSLESLPVTLCAR